jgi:DNA polymerase-3 subunit beta
MLGCGPLKSETVLHQSLQTSTDATVKKPGIVAVPARKLYNYVKLLPKGDVSI